MKSKDLLLVWFAAVPVSMWVAGACCSAEENLGKILKESRCDRIVGTWVDERTKGESVTTYYKWRFEDRVLEVTSDLEELKTVALMGRNALSGEVFHLGADNRGGSSIGSWRFENGEATLEVAFVTGEGEEAGAIIRQRLNDEKTMIVTIEAGETDTFTMVRSNKQEPARTTGP